MRYERRRLRPTRPDPACRGARVPGLRVGVIADTHIWKGGGGRSQMKFSISSLGRVLISFSTLAMSMIAPFSISSPRSRRCLPCRGNNDDNELCDRLADQETLQVRSGSTWSRSTGIRVGLDAKPQPMPLTRTSISLFMVIATCQRSSGRREGRFSSTRGRRRIAAGPLISVSDCSTVDSIRVDPSLILFSAPAELAGVDPQSMLATSAQKRSLFPPKRSDVPC